MMIHGGEAGDEDASDVFDIFEGQRCLGELTIGYLAVNHKVNRLGDCFFREVIEAA